MKLTKPLLHSLLMMISLMTANAARAEDIVLTTKPASFTTHTNQDTQGSSLFHVKMYNPTDSDMTMHYHASVCIDQYENACGVKDINKVIAPKQWLDQQFGLNTKTVSFRYAGRYKVHAYISADGTEHVENARDGEIWVYS